MLKDLVVIVLVMSKLGISDYPVTNSYIKKKLLMHETANITRTYYFSIIVGKISSSD